MIRPGIALMVACICTGCASLMVNRAGMDAYGTQRQAMEAYGEGENSKAEAQFVALLRDVPNDSQTWFYLGNVYARTDRPEQAVDAYLKSLMLDRSAPKTYYNLGVIRLRQAQAAFIQAYGLLQAEDALQPKLEGLLTDLANLPLLKAQEKAGARDSHMEKQ